MLHQAPTTILTDVNEKLKMHCATTCTRIVVNQTWILKNPIERLINLKSENVSQINSNKMYDFSTLNTNNPHDKLKTWLLTSWITVSSMKIEQKNIHILCSVI